MICLQVWVATSSIISAANSSFTNNISPIQFIVSPQTWRHDQYSSLNERRDQTLVKLLVRKSRNSSVSNPTRLQLYKSNLFATAWESWKERKEKCGIYSFCRGNVIRVLHITYDAMRRLWKNYRKKDEVPSYYNVQENATVAERLFLAMEKNFTVYGSLKYCTWDINVVICELRMSQRCSNCTRVPQFLAEMQRRY